MTNSLDNPFVRCLETDRERLTHLAEKWRSVQPLTVVSKVCERSAGNAHEYYSEGDYWWPDPKNPDGPYIRKDGETNPGNFDDHRILLRDFSIAVPGLTAAGIVLKDESLLQLAVDHLRAWCVDPATSMEPHLEYGQAIKGICKGRGIGIVDTVHLAEVAVATQKLIEAGALNGEVKTGVLNWFESYMNWLINSDHGIDERDHGNNHSTCWAMQVAAFANLLGDEKTIHSVFMVYQRVLLLQIAQDGTMPLELERTRPYNYSFFNLELFAALVQSLSANHPEVYESDSPLNAALKNLLPYAGHPEKWPHGPDIAYFEHYPIRWSALMLLGVGFGNEEALDTWEKLPPDSDNLEIQRNTPIRQPVLWVS